MTGNLTRDPELRYTGAGTAVCEFGLASNRSKNNAAGEREEEACFVEVVLWGKSAEITAKYMTRGKPICLRGRLQFEQWADKTSGQKRTRLRVVGEVIEFLGSKDQGDRPPDPTDGNLRRSSSQPSKPSAEPAKAPFNNDDDIPF